jgi:hypothetical protein
MVNKRLLFAGIVVSLKFGVVSSVMAQDAAGSVAETERQKAQWAAQYSNAGRWGSDDELGTLNLVTAQKRLEAAALVETGEVVSLSRPIALVDEPAELAEPTSYFDVEFSAYGPGERAEGFSFDYQAIGYHGSTYTHLDGLCHVSYKGRLYNDFPQIDTVDQDTGCKRLGIEGLRDGIVTRGLLVDLARVRGVDEVGPNDLLTTQDMLAWERMTGLRVSPGDALFLYTGWVPGAVGQRANYDPSIVAFLRERDVALIGADRVSGDHHLSIATLGAYLIDNADLSRAVETSVRLDRWEFMLMIAPIPTPGGTGSIVNPIAMY